jgi:hypothetical protein
MGFLIVESVVVFVSSHTLSPKRWDDFLQGLDELHKGKEKIMTIVEIDTQPASVRWD